MNRFTIQCEFGTLKSPFHIYVGEPAPDRHPLENQAHWLSRERNGLIPTEVRESFGKLHTIATENNVSFEKLCVYALGSSKKKTPRNNILSRPFLRSKVLQLEKRRNILHKDLEHGKRQKAGSTSENKIVVQPPDSLLKKTLPETIGFVFKTGKALWPRDDEQAGISRLFFLGLSLYIAAEPSKVLSLSEIYRHVMADDVAYSLAVVLDTRGKQLSPLTYRLVAQWLNCDSWQRERTIFNVSATLIDFALGASEDKKDEFHAMQKALYEALLEPAP